MLSSMVHTPFFHDLAGGIRLLGKASVQDNSRTGKDTADLAGGSAVLLIH